MASAAPTVKNGLRITLRNTGNVAFPAATTVVLSGVANDIDIVTFGIHYNGGGTGTAGNYTTIVTKSGDIRFGTIGF